MISFQTARITTSFLRCCSDVGRRRRWFQFEAEKSYSRRDAIGKRVFKTAQTLIDYVTADNSFSARLRQFFPLRRPNSKKCLHSFDIAFSSHFEFSINVYSISRKPSENDNFKTKIFIPKWNEQKTVRKKTNRASTVYLESNRKATIHNSPTANCSISLGAKTFADRFTSK